MRFPVNEFDRWYDAQGFGVKTDYGYHEGCDLNLRTGGDTDLGQELLAICNGQVTSVHEHTGIPTFGKHLHIKFDSPFGVRWVHYAHCQEILVKEGDLVSEGQLIARLGKSGVVVGGSAHLHFAIKKEPTGIDGIAKTLIDLEKWEDPIPFIEKCIQQITQSQDTKYHLFFKGGEIDSYPFHPSDKIIELETKLSSLNEELAKIRLEINSLGDILKTQERDNADLTKLLNLARGEKTQAVWQQKEYQKQVESLNQGIVTRDETISRQIEQLQKATEANIGGFSTKSLISEVIKRLLGRG